MFKIGLTDHLEAPADHPSAAVLRRGERAG